MIEFTQILLLVVIFAGHVKLALDTPSLAVTERQQGFAEFWVDGRFVKYIDLR
jgi:hypothetical protein